VYFTLWDPTGKFVNRFVSTVQNTMGGANTTATDAASWDITVRADRYPDFDCNSLQESWYRLSMAQLLHTGKDSFSISPSQYRSTEYVGAMNLEKVLGQASHTGVNARSGSQLTLSFCNLPSSINAISLTLHYEQVVNVSAAGVEVLD
jgi:hypothetical protein